ncbi:MAG TPA: chemotaxis protein [Burkholderiaceae bacterium]
MKSVQQEVDDRTNLTSSNKFELLLFRLGGDENGEHSELYGINVFKIREIVAMPPITSVAGSGPHMMGVVNLRGAIIPVIDLCGVVGCTPKTGRNIILVTEFARTTQAFAVESVEEIVMLDWNQVLSADKSTGGGLVTSIARVDGNVDNTRLAQVLDVEQILRQITPPSQPDIDENTIGPKIKLAPGAIILAADDSGTARLLIEGGLNAMGASYFMAKTGKEAWEKLQHLAEAAKKEGKTVREKVALVLTDLEMPEMDGFTLTRKIKQDPAYAGIPVVIHSSLSGSTNEDHVKSVGADAYVAKFDAEELAETIRKALR